MQIPGIQSQASIALTVGALHPTFLSPTQHTTCVFEPETQVLCGGQFCPTSGEQGGYQTLSGLIIWILRLFGV